MAAAAAARGPAVTAAWVQAFHEALAEDGSVGLIVADAALGPTGLRRLYTALTRAVLGLTVVHARPLPAALVSGPRTGRGG